MGGQKDLHTPHQLSCSLLQCSLAPSLLPQELWSVLNLRGRLRYLKSCDYCQGGFPAASSTFASVLSSCPLSHSTHFEFILLCAAAFSPFPAPALFSFPSLAVFFPLPFHLLAPHAPCAGGKQQAVQYSLVSHE